LPAAPAASAVLGSFLASSAAYYTLFEPTMSHTLELFSTSLFLWALLCRPLRRRRDAVCLGAIAGLMFLVRWQNVVLLSLLPLAFAVPRPREIRQRTIVENGIGIALGFACLASLQLWFWRSTSGSLVTVPQGAGFLTPLQPHWLQVLFSTRHGLFTWTPVALVGVAGLAWLRSRRLALHASIAFLLALYVCSIVADWWGGDAFGMRRMIGILPLLALGTASLLGTAGPRARRALLVVLVLLVLWIIMIYNGLVAMRQRVSQAFADIDVQLKQRHDLIPNLVETVKGYAQHEEGVFKEIAEARGRLLAAKSPEETIAAANQQTSALGRLLAIFDRIEIIKRLFKPRTNPLLKCTQIRRRYDHNKIGWGNMAEKILG
jgi:hypothetical protein